MLYLKKKKCWAIIVFLPPINIVQMLKIFSELVFADTLPKPTLVKLEHVKYNAVMYASPYDISSTLIFNLSASVCNQPAIQNNHLMFTS